MRVLGIDPASSLSGYALVDTTPGTVLWATTFEADTALTIQENMLAFHAKLSRACNQHDVDALVIEKVSVSWNVNTIRKISYFEAMGLVCAAQHGIPAYQVQATKARRIVLGKGTLSKEDCFPIVKERWPDVKWNLAKDGGMDQADAVVLGMAGEALAAEA